MFDCVGDPHGCFEELQELIKKLGYWKDGHPDGRQLVFVGDLVDRGPDGAAVLELVMRLYSQGTAYCILGNHDWKLLRVLRSKFEGGEASGHVGNELQITLEQLHRRDSRGEDFSRRVYQFLNGLPTIFETPDLIVVHGAYRQGWTGGRARDLHLFGETDGTKTDEGYPKRIENWKHEYYGDKTIVIGHDPLWKPEQRAEKWQRTSPSGQKIIDVDWGCCFGGDLAAYRFPEHEVVSVKAKKVYWQKKKKLGSR